MGEATETVLIYCPRCGEDTQADIDPFGIFPHQSIPCLRCPCGVMWRLSFHEVQAPFAEPVGAERKTGGDDG